MFTLRFRFGGFSLLFAALFVFMFLASTAHAAPSCPPPTKYCPSSRGCIQPDDLCLLEPVPGGATVIRAADTGGLGALRTYINEGMWQWVFGLGVAVAVLNGTAGGLMIVLSNGDSTMIDKGKTRFIWSGVGLIMLLLTGVILEFINPLGFDNI